VSFSTVSKEKLKKIIEPHFYEDLISGEYKLETIDARQLLTYNRFDLSFKLMFLKMVGLDAKFAQEAYEEHIRALSLGKFKEPGNSKKNNIDEYLKAFENIFSNIKKNGFNKEISVIPLSVNGYIANGSHRVASSIILDKKIDCVNIATIDNIYDYKFFYQRGVPQTMMDASACEFIENSKNVFLAVIWPTAVGKDNQINQLIKNVVYEKNVKLNINGAHNLLSNIYYREEWIGNVKDNFKDSQGKLVECFKSFGPIRFIAFQSNSIDEVKKIKEEVRCLFNVGKHSIHITDNHTETLRVSRMVFNENSIHFLNHAKPNKFISTHKKIEEFKAFLKKNNISNDDILLDSSITLSAYGLREAQDTDFFINDNNNIKFKFDSINIHDDVLEYYRLNKMEIIYNQRFYFYFNDIKFISFSNLYQMKLNRNETKDQNDVKLMEALVENNFFKGYYAKSMQTIYYEKIKFRHRIMKLLKFFRLYNFLKKMYTSFNLKR